MRIGESRRPGNRERDWRLLASLAERRRSSVIQTILVASSARSLDGSASLRTRKSSPSTRTQYANKYAKDPAVAKDRRIPLLLTQKTLPHDLSHQELRTKHSRLRSVRTANLFLLDRLCLEQHRTRTFALPSASELATPISPPSHQRPHLDILSWNQPLLLTLGLRPWATAQLATLLFEIGR